MIECHTQSAMGRVLSAFFIYMFSMIELRGGLSDGVALGLVNGRLLNK